MDLEVSVGSHWVVKSVVRNVIRCYCFLCLEMLLVFKAELFSVFLLLRTSQTKFAFFLEHLKHNKPHQSFQRLTIVLKNKAFRYI